MAEVAEQAPHSGDQTTPDAGSDDTGASDSASSSDGDALAVTEEQSVAADSSQDLSLPAETPAPSEEESSASEIFEPPAYVAEEAMPSDIPEGEALTAVSAVMNDRYVIDGARPLPTLDTASAKAYAVVDRENQGDQLFGLVCSPGIPVRTEMLQRLKDQSIRGLMQVIEWDAIDWPPAGGKTMCIVYERPLGGRVIDSVAQGKARIGEYDVVNRLIEPLTSAISSLEAMAQPHRSIRPGNLHFLDQARTIIVLGDCCSGPPGYSQPAIFETIERCTASQSGRGIGASANDIYALGVTIIITLLGYNPGRDKSLGEMLAIKLERGSYAAICGNARIPIALVEPLRGMLNDDEPNRWTTEEVRSWLDGRKRTPQQRKGQPKADTPYIFARRPYTSPRALAYAFSCDPEETIRTIKSDENFDVWLRRSLSNDDLADRVKYVMEQARLASGNPSADATVVAARICSMLDPKGPIRFQRYAMMPDSLAFALPVEIIVNNNKQMMADLISREVYESWFKVQERMPPDFLIWQRNFVQCKRFLAIREAGYGIERCMYEMNQALACQSPVLKNRFVSTIRELLPALDITATEVDGDVRPLDRHILAFIAARFDEDIQPHLRALGAPDEQRRTIGMLSLLAFIQWKTNVTTLHGLTSWVGGLLQPAINSYHSRTTRKEIEKAIPQLVRQGSLPELFNLIDNAEKRRIDDDGFAAAQETFNAAETEIQEIESDDGLHQSKLLRSGQKITSMAAILLAMVIIMIMLISELF